MLKKFEDCKSMKLRAKHFHWQLMCIRTSVICRQLFYLKFFFKHFFPDGGNLKSKFGINATVHYFLIDANEQWRRRMNWPKNENEKTNTISICNWKTAKSPSCNCLTNIPTLFCHVLHSYWYRLWPWLVIWSWFFQKQYLTTLLKKLKILFECSLSSWIFLNGWEKDKKEIIQPYYCSGWFPVPISFLPSLQCMNTDSFNEMPRFAIKKRFDFVIRFSSILFYVSKLK